MKDEDSLTESTADARDLVWQESLTGRAVGEFVIGEMMGEGGYGFIYRAEQTTLMREVVIKILRWRGLASHERTQRFLREARLASQLDHPYAAHIYSFGAEPDGLLWIAMELVRGTSLKSLLEAQGSLALPRFVPLLEKLCEVIYTAHQQGIVHRDIKPSNVMVLSRAGRLLPKLLDLGIARLVSDDEGVGQSLVEDDDCGDEDSQDASPGLLRAIVDSTIARSSRPLGASSDTTTLTQRGMSMGSPPYMAPEQWNAAGQSDARTDQYSLAILTYEAITGRQPFRATTMGAMALAHSSKQMPPLGEGFSPKMEHVLERALAKSATDRFGDVLEFAAAFRAASGLEIAPDPLPRLEVSLRETLLAKAPQPLADTVALLEAARSPERALEAAHQTIRVALRMLALLAVSSVARVGLDHSDKSQEIKAGLRRLRRETLSSRDWLELARLLCEPFASEPDTHPIPELVLLFFGRGDESTTGEPLNDNDPVAAGDFMRSLADRVDGEPATDRRVTKRENGPDTPRDETSDMGRSTLEELLPALGRLLGRLVFLCDYPWIVRRGIRNEGWMGARRSARGHISVSSPIDGDQVVLASADGDVLLILSPLCQRLAPAPGAPDEMFLFDGPSRFGARLVSFPIEFERHDNELWSWYREHLIDLEPGKEAESAERGKSRPPYMGLASFSPQDAESYFGREREVHACVNRLRISPFLAVVGPSGAGKSSFVQAGIIPAMPSYWRTITARPGPAPLAQLAAQLERAGIADSSASDLRAQLENDIDALGSLLRRSAESTGEPVLLVIDQFEELLTLCLDDREQRLYADRLMGAAASGDDPVRLIITLRDDFLVRAQRLPGLRERLQHALQLLSTPPPTELERIVVEPAKRAGYRFEDPELPREMVAAVADEPSALALLSFTASKLWELRDRPRRRLTRRAYKDLGGVGGALAQHAEDTLHDMTPAHRAATREVFRQLVTADGTRAVLTRGELRQILDEKAPEGESLASPVLESLIAARLLMASEGAAESSAGPSSEGASGSDGRRDRVEVVHEALLSSWPRLVEWQREDAEGARLRDQLRSASRQWEQRERPKGLLWRGEALLEYRVWRGRYPGSLTDVEEAFARASLREDTRGRRIRRSLLVVAFAVLAIGLVVVFQQRQRAESFAKESAANANRANQRLVDLHAEQGRRFVLDGDPMRAFPYLIEALRGSLDDEADRRASEPDIRLMLARAAESLAGKRAVLAGHEGHVLAARFSPDGKRIATASSDKSVKVWNAATGEQLLSLEGHGDTVWSLEFSPDGRRIATASWDGQVRAWDAETGARLWSAQHDDRVLWLGYSDDGKVLGTTSRDRSARLWNARDGQLIHSLQGHGDSVYCGAFDAKGERFVTGSLDESARVWSVATGELLGTIEDNGGEVVDLDFSPEGSRVVMASYGNVARIATLLDSATLTLTGHNRPVIAVAFSPDGKRVVTGSEDRLAKVWNAQSGELLFDLDGHTSDILSVGFNPEGSVIFTTSQDGTARTWDARDGSPLWTFIGHRDGVWRGELSPNGDRFATASFDGTAWIWNPRQTRYELALTDPAHPVLSAALAPDGRHLATIARGGTVRVWRRDGALVRSFFAGRGLGRVIWSPDSSRLLVSKGPKHAAGAQSQEASVWNASSGARELRIPGHSGQILHAGYSPKGDRIITAGADGTAAVRDATTGEARITLRGHADEVWYAETNPSGSRIITASKDRTVKLWDAESGRLLRTLAEHRQRVNSSRFSGDGSRIITATEDNIARVWSIDGTLLATLEGHNSSLPMAVLSRDGQLAATASEDGTAKLWSVRTGRLLWSIDHHELPVWSIELSDDGRHLVTTAGNRAFLWQIAYSDQSEEQLASFAACRVSYRLVGGGLEEIEIDHQACRAAGQ